MTFLSGNVHLSKLISTGNFNFQPLQAIDFNIYGYQPNKIKSADIDNDGDMDLVVSSKEYSRVQWLNNDGNGNFSYNLIAQSLATDPIQLADIDNDGDFDIVTASSNSYSNGKLSFIKYMGNGTFSNPVIIEFQSCKSLALADINNDGNIDIVGTSYEYFSPYDEKVFYYLGNGTSFGNKFIIESLGQAISPIKDVYLGELNNDNKIDIASTHYNTVNYFINNSTLSTGIYSLNNNFFSIYPNPSKFSINWSNKLNINKIIIYDLIGKVVLDKFISNSNLNISSFDKGIYIVKGISEDTIYTSKLIVE